MANCFSRERPPYVVCQTCRLVHDGPEIVATIWPRTFYFCCYDCWVDWLRE